MVHINMDDLLNLNAEQAPLLPVVDGVHVQIQPRALLRTLALGVGLVFSGCCGGLEEANLITKHDLDPEGATFEANARHWFEMSVVGLVTLGVFKLLFWLFRAPVV